MSDAEASAAVPEGAAHPSSPSNRAKKKHGEGQKSKWLPQNGGMQQDNRLEQEWGRHQTMRMHKECCEVGSARKAEGTDRCGDVEVDVDLG